MGMRASREPRTMEVSGCYLPLRQPLIPGGNPGPSITQVAAGGHLQWAGGLLLRRRYRGQRVLYPNGRPRFFSQDCPFQFRTRRCRNLSLPHQGGDNRTLWGPDIPSDTSLELHGFIQSSGDSTLRYLRNFLQQDHLLDAGIRSLLSLFLAWILRLRRSCGRPILGDPPLLLYLHVKEVEAGATGHQGGKPQFLTRSEMQFVE